MKERRDRRPRTRIGRRVSSPRPVTLERPGRGAFKLYSRFFNSAFAHNALSKSVDAITRALYQGEKGSATAHANRSPVSSPRPVTLERPGRGAFKLYSRFFWSSFFRAVAATSQTDRAARNRRDPPRSRRPLDILDAVVRVGLRHDLIEQLLCPRGSNFISRRMTVIRSARRASNV